MTMASPQEKMAQDSLRILTDLIDSHWAATKTPLPLATLGHRFAATTKHAENRLQGRKMREVIETELAGRYAVRETPGKLLSWEVYPVVRTQEMDCNTSSVGEDARKPAPWMPSAVWLAFTRPVAIGKRREATLSPFRFSDRSTDAPISEGALAIEPDFAVSLGEGENKTDFAHRVQAAVERWAGANNLVLADLADRGDKSATLFERVIQALSPEQMQRTSLPIDVINTLRNSRA